MKTSGRNSKSAEATEHLHEIGTHVRDIGSILKQTIDQKVSEIRDGAVEAGKAGAARATAARDVVEEYIREHPLKSILLASGAGMMLAFIMRRR